MANETTHTYLVAMIKDILTEIVGQPQLLSDTHKPQDSSRSQLQSLLEEKQQPPNKRRRLSQLRRVARFLDVEACQSSDASADDESDESEGQISNLFASQENSQPSPGDFLALRFQEELDEFTVTTTRRLLRRSVSNPAQISTHKQDGADTKRRVNVLREARNRRVSLSEPESPIVRHLHAKGNCSPDKIPKKYRLSIQSPFEDFRLVSPFMAKPRKKFTFRDAGDAEQTKPLTVPSGKPFPPLSRIINK